MFYVIFWLRFKNRWNAFHKYIEMHFIDRYTFVKDKKGARSERELTIKIEEEESEKI